MYNDLLFSASDQTQVPELLIDKAGARAGLHILVDLVMHIDACLARLCAQLSAVFVVADAAEKGGGARPTPDPLHDSQSPHSIARNQISEMLACAIRIVFCVAPPGA